VKLGHRSPVSPESVSDGGPILLFGGRKDRLKRRNYGGVELGLHGLSEAQACDATGKRIAVRTIRRHGVVGVCNSNDSRE
jgi:hypothetical protein